MENKRKSVFSLKFLLSRQSLLQASALVIFCSFLGKILGYLREVVIAKYLGATQLTDAFFLAQVIPVLGAGIITNAFPLAFIPFYLTAKQKDEESAQKLASAIFWGVVFYLSIISLVIITFSYPLARIIAPGFSGEQLLLTRKFLIFLLPSLVFQGLMGFFASYLQAQKHFLFPAIGAALLNLPMVLVIAYLSHKHPVYSLVLGFNLGFFVYCIVLLPAAFCFKFNPLLSFNFFSPLVKKFFILVLPVAIGSSLSYIDMLIARAVASGFGEGVISSLNYAYRLMGIPLSLIAGSIGVAVFPFMSSEAVSLDIKALAKETIRTLRATWLISLPVAVIFIALPQPLIRVMFERGAFTAENTKVTADILAFFAPGIPAMTAWAIASRAFYSLGDTITPLKIGIIQIAIDISLLLILPRFMGYRGLPLATSFSISIGFLILWYVLCKRIPDLKKETLPLSFAKITVMCAVQGCTIYFLKNFFPFNSSAKFLGNLLSLCELGGISFLFYLTVGYLIAYPEIDSIKRKFINVFIRMLKRIS
ncbi:murein biosynthesis integral membrane protein MurJ [bacterium]|nr:murein biosynthesis integral membrane protein MurJ [bacterium]